jgi:hypothetical protein
MISGFSIRPNVKTSNIEALRNIIEVGNEIQTESLAKEALIQVTRTCIDFKDQKSLIKNVSCPPREQVHRSTVAAIHT